MGANITGGRNHSRGTPSTLAEINVTPLVDVMLVLLIIFMVTAPLMHQGVPVDLPKVDAGALTDTERQIDLVVNKNQQILIDGVPVPAGSLRSRLTAIVSARPDVEVYIQADAGLPYGLVAQVLAEVRQANIRKVGLVTVPKGPGKESLTRSPQARPRNPSRKGRNPSEKHSGA